MSITPIASQYNTNPIQSNNNQDKVYRQGSQYNAVKIDVYNPEVSADANKLVKPSLDNYKAYVTQGFGESMASKKRDKINKTGDKKVSKEKQLAKEILSQIKSNNPVEQAKGIVRAGEVLGLSEQEKSDPKAARILIKSKSFTNAITSVISQDLNLQSGPTAEQLAIREKIIDKLNNNQSVTKEEEASIVISPREIAEQNKVKAILVLVKVQENYIKEHKDELNDIGNVPGIVPMVLAVKEDPSPDVRLVSILGLSNLSQIPAFKDDLFTIFSLAMEDENQDVSDFANLAVQMMNGVGASQAQTL